MRALVCMCIVYVACVRAHVRCLVRFHMVSHYLGGAARAPRGQDNARCSEVCSSATCARVYGCALARGCPYAVSK